MRICFMALVICGLNMSPGTAGAEEQLLAALQNDPPQRRSRDREAGVLYVDPLEAAADPDYVLQGQYWGWERPVASPRSSRAVGVQVVALGDGQFEGIKYYGGLPGRGWRGGAPTVALSGTRSGDLLELGGSEFRVVITPDESLILAPDGRRAGYLEKVHRTGPSLDAPPPPGAIVLFDGSDLGTLQQAKITEEGYLLAGTETVVPFDSFLLHLEFRLPFKPAALNQARSNSGVYLQSRYEVQILDSFGLPPVYNGAAALYRTRPPDINMSYPPLTWQTYDIDFTPPEFDAAGNKISNMRISVWHNGVQVHHNVEIPNKTGAGKPEGPEPLPTKLQDHGNPVVFRNIWLVPKEGPFPSIPQLVPVFETIPPVPIDVRPLVYAAY